MRRRQAPEAASSLERVAPGRWILRARNGVCMVLESLAETDSAGEQARGWWVRCLRGTHARSRYLRHVQDGGPPVEMHEVGTFATRGAAIDAADEHALQARREGVA